MASGLKRRGNFIRDLTKVISLSSTTYVVTVIYSILGFLNHKILIAAHLALSMILMCPGNLTKGLKSIELLEKDRVMTVLQFHDLKI